MTTVNLVPSTPEDFEPIAQKSFFVAVCDCDESSFIVGFGCIHPYHVVPGSVISNDAFGPKITIKS